MTRITILYTELADYVLACLRALKEKDVEIQLIHWPVNPEAPFDFDLAFTDETHNRSELSAAGLEAEVNRFKPDLILCSGWMDKDYVKVCRKRRHKIKTILALDNHWTGSARQQMASALSGLTVGRAFSHAFVPGSPQREFALRLGFDEQQIKTGFYSADVNRFNSIYHEINPEKKKAFPKRFLYMGRYVKHKGIEDLWEAFRSIKEKGCDWELWCCGTGSEFDSRPEINGLKHFGFVQPDEILPVLEQTSIYILPSHFEPWGVSVHEMAAAGFPMILSDKVGAARAFLHDGHNGQLFESGSAEELTQAMLRMSKLANEQLLHYSEFSHRIAQKNTPSLWADTMLSFLE